MFLLGGGSLQTNKNYLKVKKTIYLYLRIKERFYINIDGLRMLRKK